MSKDELFKQIKEGVHHQFILVGNSVKCKCGCNAIWWNTGYLCSSITAYPCKY